MTDRQAVILGVLGAVLIAVVAVVAWVWVIQHTWNR